MMRVGLVIYGSIETQTGGYLYDRRLLDHLASRGDRAEVISLPRRNHYPRALCDNASPTLVRRLTQPRFDVLLQDELVHPSLVFLNGWLRARARYPIVTIVHLLRSSEQTTRLRGWYSAAERRYPGHRRRGVLQLRDDPQGGRSPPRAQASRGRRLPRL